MALKIHTVWGAAGKPVMRPQSDEERDQLFAAFAGQVAEAHYPWMLPLLEAANVTVYASPNKFAYLSPQPPHSWIEIPEMGRLIGMVPWVDDTETLQ